MIFFSFFTNIIIKKFFIFLFNSFIKIDIKHSYRHIKINNKKNLIIIY